VAAALALPLPLLPLGEPLPPLLPLLRLPPLLHPLPEVLL